MARGKRRGRPDRCNLPLTASAGGYDARVVGISDGDTLTVLTAEKRQAQIRLHGIDAPETGKDLGSWARQACSELSFGEDVTIRERERDRYGRTVAEVIPPDGESLDRAIVRSGLAWWYYRYAPADDVLKGLEAEARAARRGLWSQPNPTPPREWWKGGAQVAGRS